MPIRQLAPDVAAKIAAGEVVERPASVVKELIENSIDAGATQIRVDLMGGGLQLIRITDNGSGIATDELPLALARHATSKVTQIDDLEHIRSLGFRGEALASIAAVAEVTLLSRLRGSEQGAQISATNGQLSEVSTAASPEGTTITVRNLFSAVPARLKFLKSRNTEVGHCHHLLEQYALAYPEIRFTIFSETRQIFATPGDGRLASVLVEVYGLQIAEQMVAVVAEERAGDTEHPVVNGYTSRPVCYKSTRQHISFFVNRRWVLSRMLTEAVEGAYRSLLLTGRHPIAVINIQVDPTLLDVNVHPAKTEIRFLKERRVFAAVLRAVRQTLLQEPEMPQWKPRKSTSSAVTASPPDNQFSALDELDEAVGETITEELTAETASIETKTTRPHHPLPPDNPWLTVTEEETGTKPPPSSRLWQSHIRPSEQKDTTRSPSPQGNHQGLPPQWNEDTSVADPSSIVGAIPGGCPGANPALPAQADEDNEAWQMPSNTVQISPPPPQGNHQGLPPQWNEDTSVADPSSIVGAIPGGCPETIDPQQTRRLPRLRVVGQLSQSYIVTEGEDGMYLIDQHAAHERILLERMVVALKACAPLSQLLLSPMQLTLSPNELETVDEHQQQLAHIGFQLEITDGKTVEVRAVPNVLVKHMNVRSLHELLVDLTAPTQLGHTETWEERALANVACKAAIKQNYFLTVSEMREMIEQLEQTRAPYSCCHGRPTMVHFSLSALAHEFGRR